MSDVARTVGRNTAVLVAGEALSKLASAALYFVMARELGQEDFGAFTFALSLALLTTTVAGLGTDDFVTREVARGTADGARHGLFWPAVTIKVVIGALGVAVALAVVAAGGFDAEVAVAVALLGVAAVVELLSKTIFATFQGLDDLRPNAVALLLQRTVTAAVGITALLLGAGVVVAAATYLGGALVAQLYAQLRLRRAAVRPTRDRVRSRALVLARESAPLGVATLLGTLLFRIDTTLLGLLEDEAEVGLYGAAFRLLETTLFLSFAFAAALLPAMMRAPSPAAMRPAFEAGVKVVLVGTVPIGMAYALFAAPLVDLLYGDAYAAAVPSVRLLGAATALYGLSYLASDALLPAGAVRRLPWVIGVVLVQNLALNLLLIPRYGAEAAAAATSISEATLALWLTALVVRRCGRLALGRVLLGPAVGATAMLATWAVLGDGLPVLLLAGAAYVAATGAVERLRHPEDVRGLLSALPGRAGARAS
jgi:O-antigen/teichoic acid export membrane protein